MQEFWDLASEMGARFRMHPWSRGQKEARGKAKGAVGFIGREGSRVYDSLHTGYRTKTAEAVFGGRESKQVESGGFCFCDRRQDGIASVRIADPQPR